MVSSSRPSDNEFYFQIWYLVQRGRRQNLKELCPTGTIGIDVKVIDFELENPVGERYSPY